MQKRTLLTAAALWPVTKAFAAEAETDTDAAFDVVVVGAGGAGLAAALSAAQAGAKTVVLEKAAFIGGDTLISGGYFNAAVKTTGSGDSAERHAAEMIKEGAGLNDPALVTFFTREAPVTLAWLTSLGMTFQPGTQSVYGAKTTRAHKPVAVRGTGYIKTLSEACFRAGVTILTETAAESLNTDASGRVTGVTARQNGAIRHFRAARGVVLACGGFGASKALLKRYAPAAAQLPSDSQPANTGDGLTMARALGIGLVNMTSVECVTGIAGNLPYTVRLDNDPRRFILVNRLARRFVDERSSRNTISAAIASQPDQLVYAVTDNAAVRHFDILEQKHILQAYHAGLVLRSPTLAGLARLAGLDPEALKATVSAVRKERRSPGNLSVDSFLEASPFWAVRIVLHVHVTLGGVAVDTKARVLTGEAGTPVPGLFAAGGMIGNLHGKNRIGGNGVAAAIVFGRRAGLSAAGK